jgi:hypothetical protein
LDDITSSYRFHKELESPVAFLRREWKALAIFGGCFAAILLVAVLAIDPAFFYPRLGTDPLLYYLKGLAFAETGHTAARIAVNRLPFAYVAMPGIIRVPFMLAFRDFDDQLRAIQLSNIVLVGATAAMYSYVFSWILPQAKHWLAIGFSFAFMLLSPHWLANVFAPLAEAPYAVLTTAAFILATRVIASHRPLRGQALAIACGAVLFMLAFLVKYTAPVLLVYIGLLATGRLREHPMRRRVRIIGSTAVIAGIVSLILLNWRTLFHYLQLTIGFLLFANKKGVLVNLLGLAVPAQIIPDFQLAFQRNPVMGKYRVEFGATHFDVAVTVAGAAMSLICFYGIWRARRRFTPEAGYLLAALPVLALVIPSTLRYLMTYQPLFWIFFYVGASIVFAPVISRIRASRLGAIAMAGLVLLSISGVVYLRSNRMIGVTANRGAISVANTRGYVKEVATTFRDLRRFLETLPRDRTLLVGAYGTTGRWTVISGLDYYLPDSGLGVAARTHDVYVLLECGTFEICQDFGRWESKVRKNLGKFGEYSYEPVFSRTGEHAKARVYRLRSLQ